MRYVDLRRRRYETGSQVSAGPLKAGTILLLALGFALGVIFSYAGGLAEGLLLLVGEGLLLLVAVGALAGYLVWLLTERHPQSPKTGGEKQLLMAILDAGGSITPVEAALRTSLTVDEAEQTLTRYEDRGHLLVHSRDGALLYAILGK